MNPNRFTLAELNRRQPEHTLFTLPQADAAQLGRRVTCMTYRAV